MLPAAGRGTGRAGEAPIDVLIVVGDQDTYHVDGEAVAAPVWVAELLEQEGIRALFVVQARRAEMWRQQGRTDVVAAVRRHEVGLHGRDVHPVPPELVETSDWPSGVAALLETERADLAALADALDTAPVCLSEHRGFGAPQLFAVARQIGLPYLFGFPAAPPSHSLSWYAGALNVPFDAPVDGFLGFFPAVFDDVLHDDRAFAQLLDRLREHVARCHEAALPLLVVFACHPERLCYAGALEQWQYGNGVNRGREAVPATCERRRSRADVERALANLRALVRYLRDAAGLSPITVAEIVRRYGAQPDRLERAALAESALEAGRSRRIVGGATASPAETLLAWSEAVAAGRADPPAWTGRRGVLGPTEPPPLVPARPTIDPARVALLADRLLALAGQSGHLPASIDLDDGGAVGLGAIYGAVAEVYLALHRGQEPTTVPLDGWPRCPPGAAALAERFRRCADDPLIRPALSTDAIAGHASLQSWTLKPALRR